MIVVTGADHTCSLQMPVVQPFPGGEPGEKEVIAVISLSALSRHCLHDPEIIEGPVMQFATTKVSLPKALCMSFPCTIRNTTKFCHVSTSRFTVRGTSFAFQTCFMINVTKFCCLMLEDVWSQKQSLNLFTATGSLLHRCFIRHSRMQMPVCLAQCPRSVSEELCFWSDRSSLPAGRLFVKRRTSM